MVLEILSFLKMGILSWDSCFKYAQNGSKIEVYKVKIIKLLMEKFNQDFYHYGYTFDTETMTPGGFD